MRASEQAELTTSLAPVPRGHSSANPVYEAGPSLDGPRKYLSYATLFDGRVLLAGGQDPQNIPVLTAQLYRPVLNRLDAVAPTSAAHQYHSNMWVDRTGQAILVGGNPARGSVQRLVERFEPWYMDVADRPHIASAPATIAHNNRSPPRCNWPPAPPSSTCGSFV